MSRRGYHLRAGWPRHRESRMALEGRRNGACGMTSPTLAIRTSDHLGPSVARPLGLWPKFKSWFIRSFLALLLVHILVLDDNDFSVIQLAIAPLVAGLIGAGISAAGSIGGSGISSRAAKRNTDRTISANKEMAEYAYSQDLAMWNKQNEYNSPEAQMLRLQQAGLNPNLVYGTGTVSGNTSSNMPKYQAPTAEYNYKPIDLGQGVSSAISTFQDTQMRSAQLRSIDAQVESTKQKTVNDIVTNALLVSKVKMSPDVQALLKKSVEQASFNLDTSYGLRAYQFGVKEQEAQQAKLRTQEISNRIGLQGQQKTLNTAEIDFRLNRNRLQELGISSSSSPLFAMIVQMASQAGISVKEWLQSFGK